MADLAGIEIVRLRNVVKRYGGQTVLNVDDLVLYRQECVVLAGANGSGKSTLLRLIAGIARADAGSVERPSLLLQAPVGYVPQNGGLYADLSLEDNLRFRRSLFGTKEATAARHWPYVEELGLGGLLHKTFADLSGGFQRLAAAAAALVASPQWLLLDEPFGGMDKAKRSLLVSVLERIRPEMLLVAITSPSTEDLPFQTREIVLHDGKVT